MLGRKKRDIARRLHDKVLFVDADTNAADWQTGLASIVGIIGIACGLWWADAVMASLISLSILKDGFKALVVSTISLLDGIPREPGSRKIEADCIELEQSLMAAYPGTRIQIRETGRFLRACIEPANSPNLPRNIARKYLPNDGWRLVALGKAVSSEESVDTRSRDTAT